jgi:hypothetical protein
MNQLKLPVMKKYLILAAIASFAIDISAQTLIATSSFPNATANHNQRKIVRDAVDNMYVVFVDTGNQRSVIRGVMYNANDGQWNDAVEIINGKNPTLSISSDGQIHLFFESNDAITEIRHISTLDFSTWTPNKVISDPASKSYLPVADIDSMGYLNVFWIQKNVDLTESLIYACLSGDSLIEQKCFVTKDEINDVAVANHLQYADNVLLFAVQFNQDSLLFFRSADRMETWDALYAAKGSQPCITYNSYDMVHYDGLSIRLLYLDTDSYLTEVEIIPEWGFADLRQLPFGSIDAICIDDIAPPLGYSFLFMQNGNLYHGFSYGVDWNWSTILDTISGNNIYHPSIAYKHFNPEYAVYIWMESNGSSFNIFHKQDEKYIWTGMSDPEKGKGFSITGFPNPFPDQLTLTIHVEEEKSIPHVQIYNTTAELIKTLTAGRIDRNHYSAVWNGDNETGIKVKPGVYIILCSVGDKRTARKVIYQP